MSFWDSGWGVTTIMVGGLLGICLFVGLGVWVSQESGFAGDSAKIEQLRADVSRVGVGASEDVVGQVTQWNQTIRSNQAYNGMPFIGWFFADGWDRTALIEIPEQQR